ncbi:MAG TPA: hypothetical protein VFB58_01115 [Chloroflexota bacterium]|nr:hypothetical protein [Chloroflexota bacterium]
MVSVNRVWQGMTVYGSDGEEIGTIEAVYPEGSDVAVGDSRPARAPGELGAPSDPDLLAGSTDSAPGSGTAPNPITERTQVGRIEVTRGGLLGIGARKYSVPGAVIASAEAGESVTLTVTAEECRRRYG